MVTHPSESFGNNLKIWYSLVFGLLVAVATGATGAGGGITIPPGLNVRGFGIIPVGGRENGITIVGCFYSFWFLASLSFFFFFDFLSFSRDLED